MYNHTAFIVGSTSATSPLSNRVAPVIMYTTLAAIMMCPVLKISVKFRLLPFSILVNKFICQSVLYGLRLNSLSRLTISSTIPSSAIALPSIRSLLFPLFLFSSSVNCSKRISRYLISFVFAIFPDTFLTVGVL